MTPILLFQFALALAGGLLCVLLAACAGILPLLACIAYLRGRAVEAAADSPPAAETLQTPKSSGQAGADPEIIGAGGLQRAPGTPSTFGAPVMLETVQP